MHILLVEDDAQVRGGLSAFLRTRGFSVSATTTDDGVQSISASLDAVISGYRMSIGWSRHGTSGLRFYR